MVCVIISEVFSLIAFLETGEAFDVRGKGDCVIGFALIRGEVKYH